MYGFEVTLQDFNYKQQPMLLNWSIDNNLIIVIQKITAKFLPLLSNSIIYLDKRLMAASKY